jgi:hypothetical protein
MEKTTIQINMTTLERLKLLKNHNRQSYDELLNGILDEVESEILNDEEIEEIKKSLEDVKKGRTYTIEQVAKELGVKL